MALEQLAVGVAFVCSRDGLIQQIIRDDLNLITPAHIGQPFLQLVDSGSRTKAQNFFNEIQAQHAAFDWELNVPLRENHITTLHFAGSIKDDDLLLIAARSHEDIQSIVESMLRIQNEQVNELRKSMKERNELLSARSERNHDLYDELSRLNNELHNLQRELARKNSELERLDAQKDQFLGMAAHDLRSPLNIIMTYSDFIIRGSDGNLKPEQLEFLSIIRDSSTFMLSLVNDLLDLSVIQSGNLQLVRQPTDLAALVSRTVALNNLIAEQKGVTITLDTPPSLPPALLDGERLIQVFNNLLSNAIKFSYPQGVVTVRIEPRASEVGIHVIDRGQGMNRETRDSLFQPFSHTRSRGTAGEPSTGLGLAIVHRIVAEHGGHIDVASEPGQGSTFTVWLPLAPA